MLAAADYQMPTALPALPHAAPLAGLAARTLALGYLRYASARWRGDACASAFPLRLSAFWRSELPRVPMMAPDAISPHGGAGLGIAWYQTGNDVLGFVPGSRGGFQVPVSAIPRLVRCTPAVIHDSPRGATSARPTECVSA